MFTRGAVTLKMDEFDSVRHVLLKNPRSRSFDDLLNLRNYMFKMQWVKDFFADVVRLGPIDEFCRFLTFEIFDCYEIIYRQGDVSNKLYYIVDGCCELRVKYLVDLTNNAFEDRERVEEKITQGKRFGIEVVQGGEQRVSGAVSTRDQTVLISISKYSLRTIQSQIASDKDVIEDFIRLGQKFDDGSDAVAVLHSLRPIGVGKCN